MYTTTSSMALYALKYYTVLEYTINELYPLPYRL